MRVLILSSGGKDSCYALWWAHLKGWEIAGIVTVQIRGEDSMMFQLPATHVAGLQAAAAEIPWTTITVSGTPEIEINELQHSLQPLINGQYVNSSEWSADEWDSFWPEGWARPNLTRFSSNGKIDAIVTGSLRSDYQKTRIEQMAEKLGIKSFTPLWHHDPFRHMSDLVKHDFELIFTSVSADGLDEQWVGRLLDTDNLTKLHDLAKKHRFSVDGEGGEFETTVVNAPWMKRRISIQGDTIWSGQYGFYRINTAKLVE